MDISVMNRGKDTSISVREIPEVAKIEKTVMNYSREKDKVDLSKALSTIDRRTMEEGCIFIRQPYSEVT